MDWLATHHAKVDCSSKEMTICISNQAELVFKRIRSFPKIISTLRAEKLLQKGGLGYLAYIIDDQKDGVQSGDISVVRNFNDAFPNDLPGLPPDKEIEFSIELVEGTKPISMAPHRMVPAELKELKV